jgi:hypothetical protein
MQACMQRKWSSCYLSFVFLFHFKFGSAWLIVAFERSYIIIPVDVIHNNINVGIAGTWVFLTRFYSSRLCDAREGSITM